MIRELFVLLIPAVLSCLFGSHRVSEVGTKTIGAVFVHYFAVLWRIEFDRGRTGFGSTGSDRECLSLVVCDYVALFMSSATTVSSF